MKQHTPINFTRKKPFCNNRCICPFPNEASCINFSYTKPWREKSSESEQIESPPQDPCSYSCLDHPLIDSIKITNKDPPLQDISNTSDVTSPEPYFNDYEINPVQKDFQQYNVNNIINSSQQENSELLNKDPSNIESDSDNYFLIQNIDNDECDNYFDFDDDPMDELNDTVDQYLSNNSNTKQNLRKKNIPLDYFPKGQVNFSGRVQKFRNFFYLIFTNRKKFKKEYVKKIHNYMSDYIKFPKMTRNEYRNVELYFQNYVLYDYLIISFLKSHKIQILRLIPGLSQ